jgi:hypothetical protein
MNSPPFGSPNHTFQSAVRSRRWERLQMSLPGLKAQERPSTVRKSVLLPVALLSATLGVSDKDIDAMLVGNPRKLFEG